MLLLPPLKICKIFRGGVHHAQQRGALCAHAELGNRLYQRRFSARRRRTTLAPPRRCPAGAEGCGDDGAPQGRKGLTDPPVLPTAIHPPLRREGKYERRLSCWRASFLQSRNFLTQRREKIREYILRPFRSRRQTAQCSLRGLCRALSG